MAAAWPTEKAIAAARPRWSFDKLPFVYGITNSAAPSAGDRAGPRQEDSGTTSESARLCPQRGLFVRIHAACVPACSATLRRARMRGKCMLQRTPLPIIRERRKARGMSKKS